MAVPFGMRLTARFSKDTMTHKRGKYRITIRGAVPRDLSQRISAAHASALLQTRKAAGTKPTSRGVGAAVRQPDENCDLSLKPRLDASACQSESPVDITGGEDGLVSDFP